MRDKPQTVKAGEMRELNYALSQGDISRRKKKMKLSNDKINGVFEVFGGLFIILSILQCWMDKSVAGVSLYHVGFFAGWGYWNLYYYKAIQQRASFLASIGVVAANTIWLALLIYYR